MIELVTKDKCSGCLACYNACKIGALTFVTDPLGFWFPTIDNSKCIECGACERVCPAKASTKYYSKDPEAYIVQIIDEKTRMQSSSGGAFSGIAKQIIAKGGVVFGATVDIDFKIKHTWVETDDDLRNFRGSKYVQSWIGKSYVEVEHFLKEHRKVCFSGTPCQIRGLKEYLGKEYENLVTIDVMCHSAPSPKVFELYLDYQRQKYPKFDNIAFRDKGRGYSYSCMALKEGDKVVYRGGSESDPWLRLFLGGYCNRETCHNCMYQSGVHASDLTLWDCWEPQNYMSNWDDNKGTTNVIAWTELGKELISQCKNVLRIKEIGIENIDASLEREKIQMPMYNRDKFYADAEMLGGKDFINKYVPITIKIKIKRFLRESMYKMHLHDFTRKMVHKIRKIKKGE